MGFNSGFKGLTVLVKGFHSPVERIALAACQRVVSIEELRSVKRNVSHAQCIPHRCIATRHVAGLCSGHVILSFFSAFFTFQISAEWYLEINHKYLFPDPNIQFIINPLNSTLQLQPVQLEQRP